MQDFKVDFLANYRDLIPVLAEWTYEAWSKYDPTLNKNDIENSIRTRCNFDKLPIGFVLLLKNTPIGMVNLKDRVKLDGYSDRNLWLGSFWVDAKYKNEAGPLLLNAALQKARELGFEKISDFESDLDDAEWLLQHNWSEVKKDIYQGYEVTVLEYSL